MTGIDFSRSVLVVLCIAVVAYVAIQQWILFRKRERRVDPVRKAAARRAGVTHALKMGEGRAQILAADMPPGRIVLSGWHQQAWRWAVDDFLQLYLEHGATTRYRIEKIKNDAASSMYIAELSFAPRGSSPADGSV